MREGSQSSGNRLRRSMDLRIKRQRMMKGAENGMIEEKRLLKMMDKAYKAGG